MSRVEEPKEKESSTADTEKKEEEKDSGDLEITAVPCKWCPKHFASNILLASHSRYVHGNQPKTFACDYPGCEKKFSSQSGKLAHFRRHVKLERKRAKEEEEEARENLVRENQILLRNIERIKTRLLACPFENCGKEFRSYSALSTHKKFHLRRNKFACKVGACRDAFATFEERKEHHLAHEREAREREEKERDSRDREFYRRGFLASEDAYKQIFEKYFSKT